MMTRFDNKTSNSNIKNKLVLKRMIVISSFLLPGLLFYFVFMVLPILDTAHLSLTDWNGISIKSSFIGILNYTQIITDKLFINASINTLFWLIAQLILIVLPTLILAIAISNVKKGMGFFRAAFYLPAVISFSVAAVIWGKIYDPTLGPINAFLNHVGLSSLAHNWLGEQYTVLPALVIASSWVQYGLYLVLYLSGLQSIDTALYEAADIDGANSITKFFKITIPSLSNTMNLVISLVIINAFKGFSMVWIATQGGPFYKSDLVATYIYRKAFTEYKFGYGSAAGIILALIIMLITILFNIFREGSARN
jgi:raffinose/stachyose/melibiose transport system permease protein